MTRRQRLRLAWIAVAVLADGGAAIAQTTGSQVKQCQEIAIPGLTIADCLGVLEPNQPATSQNLVAGLTKRGQRRFDQARDMGIDVGIKAGTVDRAIKDFDLATRIDPNAGAAC